MSVKCLIYCCRTKPYISYDNTVWETDKDSSLNGKIVASFDCEKVEKIVATKWSVGCGCAYYHFETKDLLRKSCLEYGDLCDYLENQNGYAIHISNLEIFDKPKELSEYYLFEPNNCVLKEIKKAPQNMYRVIKHDRLIFAPSEQYVLISIKPEWVAKILNGEKTIEVRKSVVNALKGLV